VLGSLAQSYFLSNRTGFWTVWGLIGGRFCGLGVQILVPAAKRQRLPCGFGVRAPEPIDTGGVNLGATLRSPGGNAKSSLQAQTPFDV
jgi:hypothetical protein